MAGASPDVVGEKGWTALMAAAAEGHGKIVRELLLALAHHHPEDEDENEDEREGKEGWVGGGGGGDVNARNDKGCTALIMASRNGFSGKGVRCDRSAARSCSSFFVLFLVGLDELLHYCESVYVLSAS